VVQDMESNINREWEGKVVNIPPFCVHDLLLMDSVFPFPQQNTGKSNHYEDEWL